MKLKDYLKDRIIIIAIYSVMIIFVTLFLMVLKVSDEGIIAILFILILAIISIIFYDYFRRREFYYQFFESLDALEEKYLVTELINNAAFLEGRILYQSLYEINKSMNEKIGLLKYNQEDFRDYIEMWIHEVKMPLANLILITHNNKNVVNQRFIEELKKLEDYLDQVLYYTRSENAEKDYLIKETNLASCVRSVALKNKDTLLYNKVNLKTNNININVLTDSKWLLFILNQLINNSVKYRREKEDAFIEISTRKKDGQIILSVYDNGIGISSSDLPRVFDKSFTGKNGHNNNVNSTGMGLYISKKLLEKLGHQIAVESVLGEYTRVDIIFNSNDYYSVIK